MNNEDNPYDILGVPKDASSSQIKSAYRKLALKHHPDKQTSESEKQNATARFAKISNAYEVLSDPESRRQLDQPYGNAFREYQPMHHHFHDPFDVFAQVFGEEFGSARRGPSFSRRSMFEDDFFQDPFMSSRGRGSMFQDPLFGGSMFGSSMFGRGSMFDQMQRQMNSMRQQQEEMMRGNGINNNDHLNGNGNQSYSYYSSSSSSGDFGGMNGESVTTTTRIINGKRQTITEKTKRKADGTVERHVETTGDDDFPQIERNDPFFGRIESSQVRQLPGSSSGEVSAPKKRRFFSRRKSKNPNGDEGGDA